MFSSTLLGGSLENYGAVPEDILGRIIVSVVKGLSYLWSMKIMHRGRYSGDSEFITFYPLCADIKPSNILLNGHGQVKLCDFGVSVQLLTSLTRTFIGTNAYMAVSTSRTPLEVY